MFPQDDGTGHRETSACHMEASRNILAGTVFCKHSLGITAQHQEIKPDRTSIFSQFSRLPSLAGGGSNKGHRRSQQQPSRKNSLSYPVAIAQSQICGNRHEHTPNPAATTPALWPGSGWIYTGKGNQGRGMPGIQSYRN